MGLREAIRVTDEHLVSEIGGLYARGIITLHEYEAGIRYGTIVLDYLKTIDAPEPYSTESSASFSDSVCERRKLDMAAARQVLKGTGNPKCVRVVDRVAVYGEPVYQDDIPHLRCGLKALSEN